MCSPDKRRTAYRAALAAAVLAGAQAGAAPEIRLALDDLIAPGLRTRSLAARIEPGAPGRLVLEVGELAALGRTWRAVRVACPRFSLERNAVRCAEGTLEAGEKVPLSFSYSAGVFEASLKPAAGETWRVLVRRESGAVALELAIENGAAARLGAFLARDAPRIASGALDGTVRLSAGASWKLGADLGIRGLGFSDARGLHAGEGIGARLALEAESAGESWRWRARARWEAGEVFWQPLYLRGGGHAVEAEGSLDGRTIEIREARIALAGVGEARAGGLWNRAAEAVQAGWMRSGRLDAARLYEELLRPFFFGTALGELRVAGAIEVAARVERGALESLDLALEELSFEDKARRFAVFGASGRIPWRRDRAARAELRVRGGELMRLAFGEIAPPLVLEGTAARVEEAALPFLDARLLVRGLTVRRQAEGWSWSLRARLEPVSMAAFTQALGLPLMHGTLSAEIPRVTYSRSTLAAEGALVFGVFGGTLRAENLRLIEPLGQVPRLRADLEARGLDLEPLTRTFSFGTITGRVDASVKGLELVRWRPVAFDARVESSPGEYPRRISRRAVDDIAALGGGGAVLQGTFLRFFEQFGYRRLGISCRLRNGVCEMGGVRDAEHGYAIVEGGGIPALTVMGYNRQVDWNELVERLQRVVREDTRAIVR